MKSKAILSIFILALTFFGCKIENKSKTIRLGHGLDVSHSVHKAMVKMGEDLFERSGGKLKLKIYPSQQLGTERECLELLQIGSFCRCFGEFRSKNESAWSSFFVSRSPTFI